MSEVYIGNVKLLALIHTEAIDMVIIIVFQELANIKFNQIVIYRLSNKRSPK